MLWAAGDRQCYLSPLLIYIKAKYYFMGKKHIRYDFFFCNYISLKQTGVSSRYWCFHEGCCLARVCFELQSNFILRGSSISFSAWKQDPQAEYYWGECQLCGPESWLNLASRIQKFHSGLLFEAHTRPWRDNRHRRASDQACRRI